MAKNKLPVWATTVTPLSKTIALLMLILLPIAGFFYGTYYQKQIDMQKQWQNPMLKGLNSGPLPTASQPPDGTVVCNTNADCPSDYTCEQAGPIVEGMKQHQTCFKKGDVVPD